MEAALTGAVDVLRIKLYCNAKFKCKRYGRERSAIYFLPLHAAAVSRQRCPKQELRVRSLLILAVDNQPPAQRLSTKHKTTEQCARG
jgi:hypothetical protein